MIAMLYNHKLRDLDISEKFNDRLGAREVTDVLKQVVLEWDERFSVGVDEIDLQHKKLISLLNKLNRALKSGAGHSTASDIIQELASYALLHFKTEEHYMQQVEHLNFAEHKAEHESFARQVLKFNDDLKQHNVLLGVEILFFLRDWVVDHITQVDAKMKPYLIPQGDSS
jgi:hemerythrin